MESMGQKGTKKPRNAIFCKTEQTISGLFSNTYEEEFQKFQKFHKFHFWHRESVGIYRLLYQSYIQYKLQGELLPPRGGRCRCWCVARESESTRVGNEDLALLLFLDGESKNPSTARRRICGAGRIEPGWKTVVGSRLKQARIIPPVRGATPFLLRAPAVQWPFCGLRAGAAG